MQKLELNDVKIYVEENISSFHKKRIERLRNLKLQTVLRKKNPYLFRAKNILTASELVKGIADAFISSNEETIFGDWLEGLAIYVNSLVYGGWKSGITNIDLEFDKDDSRYIVNIKSGPNWGNSSQIKKMQADFAIAKRTLRTSNSDINVIAVNGCCYGREANPDKGNFYKYCGQQFWAFISNEESLYSELIEPLGYEARARNDEFLIEYSSMLNNFSQDFTSEFCNSSGAIDWQRLVEFNSGMEQDV